MSVLSGERARNPARGRANGSWSPEHARVAGPGRAEPVPDGGRDRRRCRSGRRPRGDHPLPDHDRSFANLTDDEAVEVVTMLRERAQVHAAAGRAHVQLFVNQGRAAGASIAHPHAQLVALDFVPPAVSIAVERFQRRHDGPRARRSDRGDRRRRRGHLRGRGSSVVPERLGVTVRGADRRARCRTGVHRRVRWRGASGWRSSFATRCGPSPR